jgi:hypothetical protein
MIRWLSFGHFQKNIPSLKSEVNLFFTINKKKITTKFFEWHFLLFLNYSYQFLIQENNK